MPIRDDLEANYAAALETAKEIEAEWERQGKPLTTLGGATGRSEVAHPLVAMLRAARRDVDQFGSRLLTKRGPGPSPQAVVTARIGKAASAKTSSAKARLRSVK